MLLFARVFFRVCFNPRNSKNNNDCLDLKKFKNKKNLNLKNKKNKKKEDKDKDQNFKELIHNWKKRSNS